MSIIINNELIKNKSMKNNLLNYGFKIKAPKDKTLKLINCWSFQIKINNSIFYGGIMGSSIQVYFNNEFIPLQSFLPNDSDTTLKEKLKSYSKNKPNIQDVKNAIKALSFANNIVKSSKYI